MMRASFRCLEVTLENLNFPPLQLVGVLLLPISSLVEHLCLPSEESLSVTGTNDWYIFATEVIHCHFSRTRT